jgi:hypothetical protein
MFPTDFGNNIFEERFLKFTEVIYYSVEEIIIPIGRIPQINQIEDKGLIKKVKADGPDAMLKDIFRKRFEIKTTVGIRIIEFSEYYFLDKN